MYTSFFGLNEKPFAITPDPRYLYLSERHTEALAHLAYGISEAGGFIQLTGEVGTGKTTVLRSLLQQLPPHCDVALILNPRVTPAEFLLGICDELHVRVPEGAAGSVKSLVDLLTHFLLDAHGRSRRIVLMVDEAQNLDADVLEQVRLLTNLETATQKLLQIILIGQPELREVLARPELRQLAQRITGRYHLEALKKEETIAYVRHRARVAGANRDLFTPGAQRELHRLSGGVPRIINVIADRALLGAYTREQPVANGALVRRAASEVYGRPVLAPWLRWLALGGAAAGIALLGFVLWRAWPTLDRTEAPAVAAKAAEQPAAAPAPAPPPREALGAVLARDAASTTADAAFGSLFSLWGAAFLPGNGLACDQALGARPGLRVAARLARAAQADQSPGDPLARGRRGHGAPGRAVGARRRRRAAPRRRRRGARAGRGARRLLVRRVPRAVAAAGRGAAAPARRDARRRRALAAPGTPAAFRPAGHRRRRLLRRRAAAAGRELPAQPPPRRGRRRRPADAARARRRARPAGHADPRARRAAGGRMSFILDALRKSEIERQRQSGPSMAEFPIAREDRRLPVALIAIGFLLAVNLAVVLFFMLRDDARTRRGSGATAGAAAPAPAASAPAAGAAASPAPQGPLQSQLGDATSIEEPPAIYYDDAATLPPDAPDPTLMPDTPVSSPSVVYDDAPPTQAASGGVPQGLPELSVDLHVFAADPAKRAVFINGRRYTQGAQIAEGPVVEEITREGAVLSYRGRRFVLPRL